MSTDRSTFLCPACRQGPFDSASVAVAHCPAPVEEQLVGEPMFEPLRAPASNVVALEPLEPGVRIVNGQRMYSAAWL